MVPDRLVDAPLGLQILTDDGIGYSALLSARSHPANVLSDPSSAWTVVLSKVDEASDATGAEVARSSVAVPEDGQAILIEVDTDDAGDATLRTRQISVGEFQTRLDSLAQDGSSDYSDTTDG